MNKSRHMCQSLIPRSERTKETDTTKGEGGTDPRLGQMRLASTDPPLSVVVTVARRWEAAKRKVPRRRCTRRSVGGLGWWLQCVAQVSSVLQCVAVCCSVLQCVAVCCSVLQCVAVWCADEEYRRASRHEAKCCGVELGGRGGGVCVCVCTCAYVCVCVCIWWSRSIRDMSKRNVLYRKETFIFQKETYVCEKEH